MSKGFGGKFGSAPMKREGATVNYDDSWLSEEEMFWEWCKTMYPQAIKEFKAVRDIQKGVEDGL
jgi:hypothetical protein